MQHSFFSLLVMMVLLTGQVQEAYAQGVTGRANDGVWVDEQGVLRWQKNGQEAAFFGVNYTVPFAYGYRSHKALGAALKTAIDRDVYHFARLGLDAFRVHVWDTEISDTLGNLLENEHLDLFDYLLFKLKERHIKILITPIAFWGNGYPDKDEHTPGFSYVYGKRQALVNKKAIQAQERYLQQFFRHVNPYTKLRYGNDPDVIAMEINNEPHHSGPQDSVTAYINRMAAAVRGTGWTKPVFYNISESPAYAAAVCKAAINGVSFQWYPTGLVANHTLQGNYLPHVDRYVIPFDTIPPFAAKARMVYEFDAGDVLQSCMYPAMARSFRTAGFQWATQFAYDPLVTAYANTEYQTHYLNLAYTPSKAISLLIAGKAFHQLPRGKAYGVYPQDTVFDAFRVSYAASLSEMSTDSEFYYSNSTHTLPPANEKLVHIAGVGSSPVVSYTGSGAYFLDKLENGVWRLEVMPDVVPVKDPFESASLQKVVTRIQWKQQAIAIQLQDLGRHFSIKGLNEGNHFFATIRGDSFHIAPGTYLLVKQGRTGGEYTALHQTGNIRLNEFVAPGSSALELYNAVTDRGNLQVYKGGWQQYVGDKLKDPEAELPSYSKLVVRARTDSAASIKVKVVLLLKDATAFAAYITVTPTLQDLTIPLSTLQPTEAVLLPRPYPGFMPLSFKASGGGRFDTRKIEKLQVLWEAGESGVEVTGLRLE